MSERAAYSRVYWSIIDDKKFANVYDDDRALAAWLRLLLVADQAWPSSAHLPGNVRRQAVAILVSAELVDLQTGGRYRIHGLDAERIRRRDAATRKPGRDGDSAPTAPQLGPKRDPERPYTPGLRRDETSKDETSLDDAGADEYDTVVRWLASRKAWIDSPKIETTLARLVDRKGATEVLAAMQLLTDAEDAAQFVYGARNLIYPLSPSKVRKDDLAAEDRARFDRGVAATQRELARLRGESA